MLLAALTVSACASGPIPKRERLHLEIRYTDTARQLGVSMHVAPFFRDSSRRLLTEAHPDEVELLVTPRGDVMHPGESLEILPAGTKVRVLRVLFPSAFGAVGRPLLTPSDRIWVELVVDGRPETPVFVLVLPPDLDSEKAVVTEVNRYLTTDPLAEEVASMSAADRNAVATKSLKKGVGIRAMELAVRKPNLRRIHRDGEHVSEEWTWRSPLHTQVVQVRDGVVESVEIKPAEVAKQVAEANLTQSATTVTGSQEGSTGNPPLEKGGVSSSESSDESESAEPTEPNTASPAP